MGRNKSNMPMLPCILCQRYTDIKFSHCDKFHLFAQFLTAESIPVIVLFQNYLSPRGEQPERPTAGSTAICHKYCCYTKMGVLYQIRIYEKTLGYVTVCYINVPRCGCVEHGLVYITFYVQKHITPWMICSGPSLVRDGPLGTPAFVLLSYSIAIFLIVHAKYNIVHERLHNIFPFIFLTICSLYDV